ncbi:MAG: hypothetical protein ABIJ65_13775 [Chloroflexota bacterium]
MNKITRIDLLGSVLAGSGLGLLLAILDGQGIWWRSWLAFGILSILGLVLLVVTWRYAGSARWLGVLLLLAFGLRLGIGVSLSFILPVSGYEEVIQNAGYTSADAYKRDVQSWELASSNHQILDAFNKDYAIDQYGGLEALSALVYRYLSPDAHRPWLVILMAAIISALGVAILWLAVRLVWDEKLAMLAAWFFALYPESLWLGSSQMREPFLLTFITLAFWGLAIWQINHDRAGRVWLELGLVGLLLFSPGVCLYVIMVLAGWVWLRKKHFKIPGWGFAMVGGVLVVGVLILWVSLSRGTLQDASLLETLTGWFRLSVNWDVYQLERDSGMVQYLFKYVFPGQLKVPFIFAYGLLQPVLPAVLFDSSNLTWQIIGILRSLGWYMLLPLLIFSLIPILRSSKEDQKSAWLWLFATTWLWIAVSSLRAGGDQWDNPRYRLILLFFQALLVAKGWQFYRSTRNHWFPRMILIELIFIVLFSYWYATRYFSNLPEFSFTLMVPLIVFLSVVVILGGWWLDRRKKRSA